MLGGLENRQAIDLDLGGTSEGPHRNCQRIQGPGPQWSTLASMSLLTRAPLLGPSARRHGVFTRPWKPYPGSPPSSLVPLMSTLFGRDPGVVPPFIISIYDRLDRCTSGIEIDEMLADILFIYALMGALQAAFLTIHLINP